MNAPHPLDTLAPETSELLLRALMRNSPDRIYFKDEKSRFIAMSDSFAAHHKVPLELCIGKTDADLFAKEHADAALRDEMQVMATGEGVFNKLEKETWQGGEVTWAITTKLPLRSDEGQIIGTFGVSKDVTESMKTQRALDEANRQLIEATRQAGMAEVATGVLHNVGNVLTTMNVTANLLADRFRDSKVTSIFKVCALLRENANDLPGFFANDPRSGKLITFLENLATTLDKERSETMGELSNLLKSLDHVKDVIWMQQSYASVAGVVEPLQASEAIEDALKLSNTALMRHSVAVERQFSQTPPARGERHKVLQILVNLISNAKKAMDGKEPSTRRLLVRTENTLDGFVRIRVIDNGIGIPRENLTKIFSHGFTTRKDGHGFGLHSSAIAAKQMGGSLIADSDGPGKGATFVLTLPQWNEKEMPASSTTKPPIPFSAMVNAGTANR
ncbi:MAG: PAS domain-containing protein [Opitutaceae bacterium]|nr:PAS domain-containing protein [Opitutaceae bacterium]